MIKICLIAFLIIGNSVYSQKIFFSKLNYTDSISFETKVSELAKKTIVYYKSNEKAMYYDNLFRLQLVAKEYDNSLKTLDSLTKIETNDTNYRKIIGSAYKVYSQTLLALNSNSKFSEVYLTKLNAHYNSLPLNFASKIENYFSADLLELKTNFDNLFLQQKQNNSDSILVSDAVSLCRKYCSYLVYSKTKKISNDLLKKNESEIYIQNDSIVIPMPYGGSVTATVVRKKSFTKAMPVVIMYNIYAGNAKATAKGIANEDYIGIEVNTRGKYLSKNTIEPFEHDASDAYYIIDWISKQPWCNGKIGMYGGSYLGFSQWSATKKLHPALKTIVPQVSVGVGIDFPVNNGIFMNYGLQWIHYVTNNKTIDGADFSNLKKWNTINTNWYKSGVSFRKLDSLNGEHNVIFQRWLNHPAYDSFWQSMTPQKEEFSKINIPILTITGYFDDDQLGAMYYYKQHHSWNKNPNHYLLIGPYDHYGAQGFPSNEFSGYTIDSLARIPIDNIIFKWFNYTLKDSARPTILKDKVNFEVMGENTWKHVSSLNKMCNDTLTFYLNNTRENSFYKLSKTKPEEIEYIKEQVDFKDRTTIYNNVNTGYNSGLILDTLLYPTERKLIFSSDIITKSILFSGAMQATIFASINKKDMDIAIDIYELTSTGKYFKLTGDRQRASFAKNKTKRELLNPNKIEVIPLTNNFITSKKIETGSRLIVVVGVCKNFDWQINYGSGKDVSDESINDAKEPLVIKWYNTSTIKIPILN